jgi:hypothetical protein
MRGLAVAIVLALGAGLAAAETRALRFADGERDLLVAATFTDVFDAELLEKMASDFAQTVFVRVYLHRAGERDALWNANATHRVVYAMWDEVYLVRLRDPRGERNLRFASRAEALKAVTALQDFPVAPLGVVAPGTDHHLEVIVDVNPVAPELLVQVRRWLARPRGEKVTGDASFFGSFVSVFVNPRIADADRTLRFRSQIFTRAAR